MAYFEMLRLLTGVMIMYGSDFSDRLRPRSAKLVKGLNLGVIA